MSIQILSRGVALLFVVSVSGCSMFGPDDAERSAVSGRVVTDECKWNRSSCIYEGSYEADERDYAEEEARRLNREASRRLSRGSWW